MESLEFVVNSLLSISPAQWCQAYFILASISIVTIQILPTDLKGALLEYGPRQQNLGRKTGMARVADSLQVPHSWFSHFYVLSFGLSLFWGWQYHTRGKVLEHLVLGHVGSSGGVRLMSMAQVILAWGLMAAQGGRRLFEVLFVTRVGTSTMSGIHWLVGIVFYVAMSISVWIEGSGEPVAYGAC